MLKAVKKKYIKLSVTKKRGKLPSDVLKNNVSPKNLTLIKVLILLINNN